MKIMKQIGFILSLCIISIFISSVLPFAFPSSVIAMIILFLLLIFKAVKEEQIKESSDFFLSNMAVFFIPSGVAIIDNFEFVKNSILPFIFICFITTILTFIATAYTVMLVTKIQNKYKERKINDRSS